MTLSERIDNAMQVPSEIERLERRVQDARVVVEIGTAHGGTLARWLRLPKVERIISVDLPDGIFGGVSMLETSELYDQCYSELAGARVKWCFLGGDTKDKHTIDLCAAALWPHRADFLFIDGDHTYEGVKSDFEKYSPLVRKGGIIAFHDIAESKWMEEQGVEVRKFWNEIKDNYEHEEYIDTAGSIEKWPQSAPYGFGGIGVLVYA